MEAFNDFITQAKRLGLDESSAEDVVQDIAIEAMHKLERFSDSSHFRKWAHTTLRFRCMDYFAERIAVRFCALSSESAAVEPGASTVKHWERDVRDCIENLPTRQREVLERLAAGESPGEIAEAIKIDISTVRSLKRHALSNVKSQLLHIYEQMDSDHE